MNKSLLRKTLTIKLVCANNHLYINVKLMHKKIYLNVKSFPVSQLSRVCSGENTEFFIFMMQQMRMKS